MTDSNSEPQFNFGHIHFINHFNDALRALNPEAPLNDESAQPKERTVKIDKDSDLVFSFNTLTSEDCYPCCISLACLNNGSPKSMREIEDKLLAVIMGIESAIHTPKVERLDPSNLRTESATHTPIKIPDELRLTVAEMLDVSRLATGESKKFYYGKANYKTSQLADYLWVVVTPEGTFKRLEIGGF